MKIRMLRRTRVNGQPIGPNQTVTVTDSLGRRFIDRGLATEVKPPQKRKTAEKRVNAQTADAPVPRPPRAAVDEAETREAE